MEQHGYLENKVEIIAFVINNVIQQFLDSQVVVAEWLRRWTRNPLGSSRAGSNPADYEIFFLFKI